MGLLVPGAPVVQIKNTTRIEPTLGGSLALTSMEKVFRMAAHENLMFDRIQTRYMFGKSIVSLATKYIGKSFSTTTGGITTTYNNSAYSLYISRVYKFNLYFKRNRNWTHLPQKRNCSKTCFVKLLSCSYSWNQDNWHRTFAASSNWF